MSGKGFWSCIVKLNFREKSKTSLLKYSIAIKTAYPVDISLQTNYKILICFEEICRKNFSGLLPHLSSFSCRELIFLRVWPGSCRSQVFYNRNSSETSRVFVLTPSSTRSNITVKNQTRLINRLKGFICHINSFIYPFCSQIPFLKFKISFWIINPRRGTTLHFHKPWRVYERSHSLLAYIKIINPFWKGSLTHSPQWGPLVDPTLYFIF